jgi:hypothetical protein
MMDTSRGKSRLYEKISIFGASPRDVDEERHRMEKVVGELDKSLCDDMGITLHLQKWEDVSPEVGKPAQQVVLDEIPVESWDILVIILWHRFGTPPGSRDEETGEDYRSGTEEEFHLAYRLWKEKKKPTILAYHCQRPIPPEADPEQWGSVKKFIAQFDPWGKYPGLVGKYESVDEFEDRVRNDLTKLLSKRFRNALSVTPDPDEPAEEANVEQSQASLWDDGGITDIGWDERDQEALTSYFQRLVEYDPVCEELFECLGSGDPEQKVRHFLAGKKLLAACRRGALSCRLD